LKKGENGAFFDDNNKRVNEKGRLINENGDIVNKYN
jgi:hypothetical protein